MCRCPAWHESFFTCLYNSLGIFLGTRQISERRDKIRSLEVRLLFGSGNMSWLNLGYQLIIFNGLCGINVTMFCGYNNAVQ